MSALVGCRCSVKVGERYNTRKRQGDEGDDRCLGVIQPPSIKLTDASKSSQKDPKWPRCSVELSEDLWFWNHDLGRADKLPLFSASSSSVWLKLSFALPFQITRMIFFCMKAAAVWNHVGERSNFPEWKKKKKKSDWDPPGDGSPRAIEGIGIELNGMRRHAIKFNHFFWKPTHTYARNERDRILDRYAGC